MWIIPVGRQGLSAWRTLLLLACLATRDSNAASLETYVEAVGGQSICGTFGPATPGLGFFLQVAPSIPIDGLGPCGVAGDFRTTTATVAPLSDTMSIDTTFNPEPNTVSGTASSTAWYGQVGAKAHSTLTGSSNGLIVDGAAGYAIFRETLDASSPSVTTAVPGAIRLTFTVDGSLSMTGAGPGTGSADVELNYSINSGPSFILMRAQAGNPTTIPFVATGTGGGGFVPPGFATAPGSLVGSASIDTFDLPITWGNPIDIEFGILAAVIPPPGVTGDVDFFSTAKLTRIQLFANGQPVTNFSLVSHSGAFYDGNGVHTVPEPSMAILSFAGIAALFGFARWRA